MSSIANKVRRKQIELLSVSARLVFYCALYFRHCNLHFKTTLCLSLSKKKRRCKYSNFHKQIFKLSRTFHFIQRILHRDCLKNVALNVVDGPPTSPHKLIQVAWYECTSSAIRSFKSSFTKCPQAFNIISMYSV